MNVRPFVKWAGGKTQILTRLREKYPPQLGGKILRYCEPFLGGGAVFFDVISHYNLQEVLINDINAELINAYIQIKNQPKAIIKELQALENLYLPLNHEDRKKVYYEKRELFNYLKSNSDEAVNLEKATLFIYLNKTCFNGLFRVNKKGLFNVPMGDYKTPVICDKKNLYEVSLLLQKVTIKCGDYKDCLSFADKNTFFYIDPPYRPLSETSHFTSYAETSFNDKEQTALGNFVDKLHAIGAKVVVSNSDPKNSNKQDLFFDELYKSYSIKRIAAKRMINCNGNCRGNISELLISNY